MTLRIVADRDGVETDITEGVKALYDLVLGSMDWGSGFWTADDAAPVLVVAEACGFADADRVREYIGSRTHEQETSAWWQSIPASNRMPRRDAFDAVHEHVLSSVGRCMWPGCRIGRDDSTCGHGPDCPHGVKNLIPQDRSVQ